MVLRNLLGLGLGLAIMGAFRHADQSQHRGASIDWTAAWLLAGGLCVAIPFGVTALQQLDGVRCFHEVLGAIRRIRDTVPGQHALLGGQIATSSAPLLRAPLSGRACVYHGVEVQRWPGAKSSAEWTSFHEAWSMIPFVVKDDSAALLVSTPENAPRAHAWCCAFLDAEIARAARVYTSNEGVAALPDEARAFLTSQEGLGVQLVNEERLRVIEVALCEGDLVTVGGAISAHGSESVYRSGALELAELRSLHPMSPADLLWLDALGRRTFLVLCACALVGFATLILGLLRLGLG